MKSMLLNKKRIKNRVEEGLAAQFSSLYSWSDMIDDCGSNEAERQWAKKHLSYSVVEL